MRKSFISIALAAVALSGCGAPAIVISNGGSEITLRRTITTTANAPARVSFITSLNPDCAIDGNIPVVRVTQNPANGTLEVKQVSDFPNFLPGNPRAKCNTQRVSGTAVTYKARTGFIGEDGFAFEYFTPNGRALTQSITAVVR